MDAERPNLGRGGRDMEREDARLRTHNQKMRVAPRRTAERKIWAQRS